MSQTPPLAADAETDTTHSTSPDWERGRRRLPMCVCVCVCVCVRRHRVWVPSNDMLQLLHGPTYPPPPLLHAQNCANRHNGDVSYTYTGILSSQSSVSDTILCEKNYGPAKGGGGIAQCPPLNTPLVFLDNLCFSCRRFFPRVYEC